MIRKTLDERLKPHGLGGLQYTILTLVRDRDGISSAELSRRFFVTPQTMNETVNGLERRGLIQRRESPENRRILQARVTEAGRDLLALCDPIADAIEDEVFGPLDPATRDSLHEALAGRLAALQAGG